MEKQTNWLDLTTLNLYVVIERITESLGKGAEPEDLFCEIVHSNWRATRIIALCQRCHQTLTQVRRTDKDADTLPFGLLTRLLQLWRRLYGQGLIPEGVALLEKDSGFTGKKEQALFLVFCTEAARKRYLKNQA